MKTDYRIRQDMLDVVKLAILDHATGNTVDDNGTSRALPAILFKAADTTTLSVVTFSDMIAFQTADKMAYKFKYNGSYVLRGVVINDGDVAYFDIPGIRSSQSIKQVLTGTVGTAISTADIRFNKISWTSNTTITLTNLTLVMS